MLNPMEQVSLCGKRSGHVGELIIAEDAEQIADVGEPQGISGLTLIEAPKGIEVFQEADLNPWLFR